MKSIKSILFENYRPWLEVNNQVGGYYLPLIRNYQDVEEAYFPKYTLKFPVVQFSDKVRFYCKMIDNDIVDYLNRQFDNSNNSTYYLKAFWIKKSKEALEYLIVNTYNIIERLDCDMHYILSKHIDFNIDRQQKETSYILNYLLVSLMKSYLEMQEIYKDQIKAHDVLTIDDLFARLISIPTPEYINIDKIETIKITSEEEQDEKYHSFRYKHFDTNSSGIMDTMISLKKFGFIEESTSIADFRKVFSGKKVTKPIVWTGKNNALNYFIKLLNNDYKLLSYQGKSVWKVVCDCFVDANGERFNEKNLKDIKKPKLDLNKITKSAQLMK